MSSLGRGAGRFLELRAGGFWESPGVSAVTTASAAQVQENSPAQQAGLEPYFDFIITIGHSRLVRPPSSLWCVCVCVCVTGEAPPPASGCVCVCVCVCVCDW